jgi:hypothetical protein
MVGRHGFNASRFVVARLDRATQYAATFVNVTLSPLTTDPGYWIARFKPGDDAEDAEKPRLKLHEPDSSGSGPAMTRKSQRRPE